VESSSQPSWRISSAASITARVCFRASFSVNRSDVAVDGKHCSKDEGRVDRLFLPLLHVIVLVAGQW
jgi:hypothetical protein